MEITYDNDHLPQIFAKVTVPGAEQFFSTIALVPSVDPLRAAAATAFSEYFLEAARDVYPRHGFATIDAEEFGKVEERKPL